MNNAPFGPMSRLYHQPRQPMQQPMQGGIPSQMQGRGPMHGAMGSLMGQMIGLPQQRRPQGGGSAMDRIIAQLMQRKGG